MKRTEVVFFCSSVVRRSRLQLCGLVFQWCDLFKVVFLEGRIDTLGIVIELDKLLRTVIARRDHRYVAFLAGVLPSRR
jgi:hypothetical protein